MAALNFPTLPTLNQQYPTPAIPGVPVYTWDGEKWTTYGASITNAFPATALPLMDATPAVVGITSKYAREDHVHPTDVTRADVNTVLVKSPQGLTPTEQTDVRKNVYAAPFDALAYSGMQINGSMEVSQENGGSTITVSGPSKYIVDGWIATATGAHNLLSGQSSALPPGFAQSLQAYATVANASPAAGDRGLLTNVIEGYRMLRLAFGTASAQSVTIGFWVYCSTTGLFSGSMRNGVENRSCVFTYTINAPLTWEYKTVTLPGDTAGTWAKNNTLGAEITFTLLSGSTYLTATTGAWVAGNFVGVTGTTNLLKNTTDYLMLTGVVVLPGIEAPTAARSPLIMRPYDQELVTCQRYWQWANPGMSGFANTATSFFAMAKYPEMRAAPTSAVIGGSIISGIATTTGYVNISGVTSQTLTTIDGYIIFGCGTITTSTLAVLYPPAASRRITLDARL